MDPESKHLRTEKFRGYIDAYAKLSVDDRNMATRLLIDDTVDLLLKADGPKPPFNDAQKKFLKEFAYLLIISSVANRDRKSWVGRIGDYWKQNVTWAAVRKVAVALVVSIALGSSLFSQDVRTTLRVQWIYEYVFQDAPAATGTKPNP